MALDEPTEEDEVQTEQGFQFIINRSLLAQVGGVTVDYMNSPFRRGFNISANHQFGNSCSSGTCSC